MKSLKNSCPLIWRLCRRQVRQVTPSELAASRQLAVDPHPRRLAALVFAVLDLTQGYHQAPLTLAARAYTAFILFCGVYQFTRLPFGPKQAPSYFQQIMTTVVLAGLIYSTCEMYIDDCKVFGKDIDELISRLRLVFERFRKHKVFALDFVKCYLGYAEIDYVEKGLSADGLRMSQEKIRTV